MPSKNINRKPETLSAWQFAGTLTDARDLLLWAGANMRAVIAAGNNRPYIEVTTEDGGVMTAGPQDWILKVGTAGYFQVIAADDFPTMFDVVP